MDAVDNPFSPGAGTPPPELAGRDELLEKADILLKRVLAAKSQQSLIITGLRGVGKTVLLNSMNQKAQELGYKTILVEAHDEKKLPELLVPGLRQTLFSIDKMAAAGNKAKRGLAVLKSFLSGIKVKFGEIEIGIEAEKGTADTGDIEADLPELLMAIAEAAKEKGTGVAILIDELQYLTDRDFSALIMSAHKISQINLPLVIIGAGLPQIPGMAGDSKSYAERLFDFSTVGALESQAATAALSEPIHKAKASITAEALDEIKKLTECYPYFLQEWGYVSWNTAPTRTIDLQTVNLATPKIISKLDDAFFRVRFDRLTPREKEYMRALAELGPGQHRSGDVASTLKAQVAMLGAIRDSLIKKGMIYSPTYGEITFTVPLFDQFMRRAMPESPKTWEQTKKSKAGRKKK